MLVTNYTTIDFENITKKCTNNEDNTDIITPTLLLPIP